MSIPIQPLKDYLVVEKHKAGEVKTASGLIIAKPEKDEPVAKVLAVGKEVKEVKVGDKVVFKSFATTEVGLEYGGVQYSLIKEEDILAIVK